MTTARRAAEHLCPGCDRVMAEVGCKIRCRACGYFEDCGDGLTPPPIRRAPGRSREAEPHRASGSEAPARGIVR